jgi:uracil phosphoribosyltransferase
MPLHLLDHPLAAHIITHLRDKTTKPATFRTLTYQLSLLLAIKATGDIETEEKVIRANAIFDELGMPAEERGAWIEAF